MFKKFLTSTVMGVAALGVGASIAAADVLEDVEDRGTLIAGVKADYPPFGYRDSGGDIVGLEIDLAEDIAERLDVDIELVPVVASNRMEFLEQGKVDVLIATMTNTDERAKVVDFVEPGHYASGTNILAPKKAGFTEWSDLEGKPVCGVQGAFYNRRTQQDYGAELIAFKGTSEAYTALQQGRCLAFVYDDAALLGQLENEEWSEFEMPLETIDESPWGIAVAKGEDNFREMLEEVVIDWHGSGTILELEDEYGINNTPYAKRMHEEYKSE
ncbi:MAG: transporter substrate-binding domain-containing protein [Pseudomonadota bacterium]|uniref:transporter substrate-binding domain-containing protein n=1 Tax=Fodinicurvata fenggangensis TaxID=1121830 RepID=UPI00047AF838|nr:transporter substrate-binding domain-containing protein [Fodinicurvata fenggangensis]